MLPALERGGLRRVRDLSRLRVGEEARRERREWGEGAVGGWVSGGGFCGRRWESGGGGEDGCG